MNYRLESAFKGEQQKKSFKPKTQVTGFFCKNPSNKMADCWSRTRQQKPTQPDKPEVDANREFKLLRNNPDNRQVLSGEDQMTCERQVAAAQRHMMDGNTEVERLEHLKPAFKTSGRLALSRGIYYGKLQ